MTKKDRIGVYFGSKATTDDVTKLVQFLNKHYEDVETNLHKGQIIVGYEE